MNEELNNRRLRLDAGGLINREQPLDFSFNGRGLMGFAGDTVASALLAQGVHFVGRSFKYHRPRGIMAAGVEEPNALLTIGEGDRADPNRLATTAELYSGLVARSQNHLGSLEWDWLAINDALASILAAGFYYKTFMWPPSLWERLYEPLIRRAAGLGALSGVPDPSHYDKGYRHCDVLIIGSGAAGLMAALAAGRAGLEVILAEQDFILGGRCNAETDTIDNQPPSAWVGGVLAELTALQNIRLMPRTTVYGVYDHGIYGAFENSRDPQGKKTLWRIYAKHAILASGALERPIAFGNNDRPGIMLAGAAREYANRYGVAVGAAITILTNNNDGWQTAYDLNQKGIGITALIDTRAEVSLTPPRGVRVIMGAGIANTKGRCRVKEIRLTTGERLKTDAVGVSGGWSPVVHLTCHHGGRPEWDGTIAGFVPSENMPKNMTVVGAAAGKMGLGDCLADGITAGVSVAQNLGKRGVKPPLPTTESRPFAIVPCWHITSSKARAQKARAWIDFQNDVTTKDISQAEREGFGAVEHLKRYTTLGMATDQGKTGNVVGLGVLAEISGKAMAEVGTTVFRPPFTPIPIGAFAGTAQGKHFMPTRLPPSHRWAVQQGASFTEAGLWLRAQWYPQKGENHWLQSVNREVIATRSSVGVCDVSTLGKIDIKGTDAATFINRIYSNNCANLAVGRVRYGLMLRDDGFAFDDGTVARMAAHHFIMTTTTANAGRVYQHLEFCRQCLWPGLDVALISTTDQTAQYAIAGPNARAVLERIIDDGVDISNTALPFMACRTISICHGIKANLFRISFSGELAYELAVPARYGESLMAVLMEAGAEFGITPYGVEALNVLRIEKGHLTSAEINGQMSAHHLGLERMLSPKKDYIGRVMAQRPELMRPDGVRLVGVKPLDPQRVLSAGAHFLALGAAHTADNDLGWMSSVAFSPILQSWLGLGFVKNGRERIGTVVQAVDFMRDSTVEVEVVSPHFLDPEGRRLHG